MHGDEDFGGEDSTAFLGDEDDFASRLYMTPSRRASALESIVCAACKIISTPPPPLPPAAYPLMAILFFLRGKT